MSEVESPSPVRRPPDDVRARHPHREIAELLATAIVRARIGNRPDAAIVENQVCLGFIAGQSVNANPAHMEGVQE